MNGLCLGARRPEGQLERPPASSERGVKGHVVATAEPGPQLTRLLLATRCQKNVGRPAEAPLGVGVGLAVADQVKLEGALAGGQLLLALGPGMDP